MKNLLLLLIFACCIAPAFASPLTMDDLEQLRISQRELLDSLDRRAEVGDISSPELLFEVESMMKHFSRVQDLVTTTSVSESLASNTLGTAHQAYLKSYQSRVAKELGLQLDGQRKPLVVQR